MTRRRTFLLVLTATAALMLTQTAALAETIPIQGFARVYFDYLYEQQTPTLGALSFHADEGSTIAFDQSITPGLRNPIALGYFDVGSIDTTGADAYAAHIFHVTLHFGVPVILTASEQPGEPWPYWEYLMATLDGNASSNGDTVTLAFNTQHLTFHYADGSGAGSFDVTVDPLTLREGTTNNTLTATIDNLLFAPEPGSILFVGSLLLIGAGKLRKRYSRT